MLAQSYKLIQMIFLTLLSLLCLTTHQQVNHTAIQPTIVHVKPSPEIKTVPSRHTFTIPFQNMGYQISGRVYETNEGLLDAQIHNKSNYVSSTSCHFYNSQLSLEVVKHKIFEDGLNVQTSEVAKQGQIVYVLINDKSYLIDQKSTRGILAYSFNASSVDENNRNVSIKALGLNDSELIDIELLSVGNVLIATDGVKFVGIDAKNLSKFWQITLEKGKVNESAKVDYQFASFNEMLQFDLCHIDINSKIAKITLLWNSVIKVYHFSLDMATATLVEELTPPSGKLYTGAIIQHSIYALIEGQLVVYRSKPNSTFQASFIDLQSRNCWGLNKYETTLHIVCKEGGLNYVAQYYFNQEFILVKDALHLNRYYTQIDDAQVIFMFGEERNPKLFIGGENDLLLTAYAINRQVLIDSNQKQTMTRYKSLGLENIVSLPKLSNFSSTYAVGIATQFIVFFRINEIPAQVECSFERKDNKMRWNVLVEVNTTNCPGNGEIQQLESICQYSVPFTYYVSLFEVDSSKELTVHIFVYVVLIAIGLLLLGCIFHCKSLRARAVREIQKKMEALKKKKGHKPI